MDFVVRWYNTNKQYLPGKKDKNKGRIREDRNKKKKRKKGDTMAMIILSAPLLFYLSSI